MEVGGVGAPKRGGLGAKLPSLELTHFVTGSTMFFVVLVIS